MKGYVIVYATVSYDGESIEDCAPNFGLAITTVYKTKEDAENALQDIRRKDSDNLAECFRTEDDDDDYETFGDGYQIFEEQGVGEDKELQVYFNGELISETIYRVEEVEF